VKKILHQLETSPNEIIDNNLHLLSHVRLPKINEIICVDDLNVSDHLPEKIANTFSSHVTWCYPHRRAIVNFIIYPLPFIGNSTTASYGQDEQTNNFECFLEYLNDCTKKFCLLKEFYIREGVQTTIIEQTSDINSLIFAKCWRIRLSDSGNSLFLLFVLNLIIIV
jgi:hypothetical protein